jgi:hypothetical protein
MEKYVDQLAKWLKPRIESLPLDYLEYFDQYATPKSTGIGISAYNINVLSQLEFVKLTNE